METKFEVFDNVGVLTLGGTGTFPWGTKIEEHRINPMMISTLNRALDDVEERGDVHCLVVTGEGKFFSNGLDLRWVDAHPQEAQDMQQRAERLMARIVTFPVPTIAALNGHWCAAGGMLGLSFDCRVANVDRGYFFVPAIDIGLVYSPGMTALMQAKTPLSMHRDMIVFAKRYKAMDLLPLGVVDRAVPKELVVSEALSYANTIKSKGSTPLHRKTMNGIKMNLYKDVWTKLTDQSQFQEMGFSNKPAGVFAAPRAKL